MFFPFVPTAAAYMHWTASDDLGADIVLDKPPALSRKASANWDDRSFFNGLPTELGESSSLPSLHMTASPLPTAPNVLSHPFGSSSSLSAFPTLSRVSVSPSPLPLPLPLLPPPTSPNSTDHMQTDTELSSVSLNDYTNNSSSRLKVRNKSGRFVAKEKDKDELFGTEASSAGAGAGVGLGVGVVDTSDHSYNGLHMRIPTLPTKQRQRCTSPPALTRNMMAAVGTCPPHPVAATAESHVSSFAPSDSALYTSTCVVQKSQSQSKSRRVGGVGGRALTTAKATATAMAMATLSMQAQAHALRAVSQFEYKSADAFAHACRGLILGLWALRDCARAPSEVEAQVLNVTLQKVWAELSAACPYVAMPTCPTVTLVANTDLHGRSNHGSMSVSTQCVSPGLSAVSEHGMDLRSAPGRNSRTKSARVAARAAEAYDSDGDYEDDLEVCSYGKAAKERRHRRQVSPSFAAVVPDQRRKLASVSAQQELSYGPGPGRGAFLYPSAENADMINSQPIGYVLCPRKKVPSDFVHVDHHHGDGDGDGDGDEGAELASANAQDQLKPHRIAITQDTKGLLYIVVADLAPPMQRGKNRKQLVDAVDRTKGHVYRMRVFRVRGAQPGTLVLSPDGLEYMCKHFMSRCHYDSTRDNARMLYELFYPKTPDAKAFRLPDTSGADNGAEKDQTQHAFAPVIQCRVHELQHWPCQVCVAALKHMNARYSAKSP